MNTRRNPGNYYGSARAHTHTHGVSMGAVTVGSGLRAEPACPLQEIGDEVEMEWPSRS